MTTRDRLLIALFAALTAIGAFIRIPTPLVPFTLQYLFCAYAGIFLGAKKGLYSQLLYVGIGLIGVPVFTQGGGPSYVLQPTFGYLLGFMACAFVVGKFTENMQDIKFWRILIPVLLGLAFVYLLGLVHLYAILNFYLGKAVTIDKVVAIGFLPYITSDFLLSLLVAATAVKVIPALRRAGYR